VYDADDELLPRYFLRQWYRDARYDKFGGRYHALPFYRQARWGWIAVLGYFAFLIVTIGVAVWPAGLSPATRRPAWRADQALEAAWNELAQISSLVVVGVAALILVGRIDVQLFKPGKVKIRHHQGVPVTLLAFPLFGTIHGALFCLTAAGALGVMGTKLFEDGFAAAGVVVWAFGLVVTGSPVFLWALRKQVRGVALDPYGLTARFGHGGGTVFWDQIDRVDRLDHTETLLISGPGVSVGIGAARLALNARELSELIGYYRGNRAARAELGTPASLDTVVRFRSGAPRR
jgi:hypothetical protein